MFVIIINKTNRNDLLNISLHDMIFNSLVYDHSNSQLFLYGTERKNIEFNSIIFVSMTDINFWGPGGNIFSCRLIDTSEKIKLLKDEAQKISSNWNEISKFSDKNIDDYLGIEIKFRRRFKNNMQGNLC